MFKRNYLFIILLLLIGACSTPPQEDIVTLYYSPMQCETTPWKEWYQSGNIQFTDEPSGEELITTYFGQEKGAEVLSVEKIERTTASCQTCDVCPRDHYFKAEVEKQASRILVSEGWKTLSPVNITENPDTSDEATEASVQ